MHIDAIKQSVMRFREVMDDLHGELGLPFEDFPRGCCGDVAELLAAFLKDEGFGAFAYLSGWCSNLEASHAWLQKESIIVDATADQFSDGPEQRFVTIDATWHAQFSEARECRFDGDFRLNDDFTAARLGAAYDRIKQYLSKP